MKIAIIGASGFIGNRLVERIQLAGLDQPVPIVRRASSMALPARFDLECRLADALDVDALARALSGCDAVVHAALGDPRQIEAMPAALTAAVAQAGIKRVVYLSSASVHGQAPDRGTDESTPLHTNHALEYNNAKVRAERAFLAGCASRGLEGFALRPGVVYGPRSRWIADLAEQFEDRTAWLLGDGDGICNCIYVDNLLIAAQLALEAPASAAGVYLVNDPGTHTWADFLHRAADELGVDPTTIHRLDRLPTFKIHWAQKARRAAEGAWMQRVLPLVPGRVKYVTKTFLDASRATPPPSSWKLPATPAPAPTQEMALLQQCRWRLPDARAVSELGYAPAFSFEEGMQRSFAWWKFLQQTAA